MIQRGTKNDSQDRFCTSCHARSNPSLSFSHKKNTSRRLVNFTMCSKWCQLRRKNLHCCLAEKEGFARSRSRARGAPCRSSCHRQRSMAVQILHRNSAKQKHSPFGECLYLAEKEGFEPSLRFSRTTPLAGEPLRPLGYFSE